MFHLGVKLDVGAENIPAKKIYTYNHTVNIKYLFLNKGVI